MPPDLPADVSSFFEDCPASTEDVSDKVSTFLKRLGQDGLQRPVAVVTSGGTIVPLEQRCVRFIDNFSGGTRGALSAEYLLQAGYAVIFLTRKTTIQPFTPNLPAGTPMERFKLLLELSPDGEIALRREHVALFADELKAALAADASGSLLVLPFVTLFEYLQYLRIVCKHVDALGPRVLFLLAAAVSDFYIPWSQLVEHKIQSTDGPLELKLERTPKMLGVLRKIWAPEAFVVSFKLETDQALLIKKARAAIQKYAVHAVIANMLNTRKDEVLLVLPKTAEALGVAHSAAASDGQQAAANGPEGAGAAAAPAVADASHHGNQDPSQALGDGPAESASAAAAAAATAAAAAADADGGKGADGPVGANSSLLDERGHGGGAAPMAGISQQVDVKKEEEGVTVTALRRPASEPQIEKPLIDWVVGMHRQFMKEHQRG